MCVLRRNRFLRAILVICYYLGDEMKSHRISLHYFIKRVYINVSLKFQVSKCKNEEGVQNGSMFQSFLAVARVTAVPEGIS